MNFELKRKTLFSLLLAFLVIGLCFTPAHANSPPDVTEIGKYLIIGTTSNDIAKGVNVQNGDLGADVIMLSDEISDNVGFDNQDVFGDGPSGTAPKNWSEGDNSPTYTAGPGTSDYLQATSQLGGTVTAATIFEGIDWSGNVALTSPNAKFDMSNVEVYADLGVIAASSSPDSSVSNTVYFADGVLPTNGQSLPPNGLTSSATTDMANLRSELDTWEAFVRDLAPEVTLDDSDLDPGDMGGLNNEKLWVIEVDQYDTNSDGIAVIDLSFPGADLNITNTNLVIQGDGSTFAIFRILGDSNLVLNKSTIVLGNGYTSPVDELGAIFVKANQFSDGQGGFNAGEALNSGDTVLSFNDTVLNGVGFWDLIEFGDNSDDGNFDDGTTELKINNGQGCSQFISPKINFNNVRWNKCTPAEADDVDYGDAPDTGTGTGIGNYNTLASDNGPNHVIVSGLNLGSVAPDADDGTLQNTAATADDDDNTDDEDSVSTLPTITTATTSVSMGVSATNTTGTAASLVCYIDFNRDGDFTDTGERAAATVSSSDTTNPRTKTLTFSGFATPVAGDTYIRCRIANAAGEVANPTGAANTGEVEDYKVTISDVDLDFGDLPTEFDNTVFDDDGARHIIGSLKLGSTVDADSDGQEDPKAGTDTTGGDDNDGTDDVVDGTAVCSTARHPTGLAEEGEVEDHQFSFDSTAIKLSRFEATSMQSLMGTVSPAGPTVAALAFLAGTVAVGGVLVRRRQS